MQMLETQSTKVVRHLVAPGYEQARGVPLVGETIQDFLEREGWDFKIPTICVHNGAPVLRAEWAVTNIDVGEVIFVSRPHGGGGGSKLKQVFGIVATIALAAIAPWAAGVVAPMLGITSAIGVSLLTAGIAMGGALLISTLVKVSPGGQANQSGLPDASQVYSLAAAGNSGRPLETIPVNYGKLKIVPDYASSAWSEYISNEQYVNVLLVVGTGKHQIHQVLIDDTILWDEEDGMNSAFTNVQMEFYLPGSPVTLFPSNIQQSSEVSGQELSTSWVGGYIANASGTTCYKLVVDIAFPSGMFYVDSEGNYSSTSVTVDIYVRAVNNVGSPISAWFLGASRTVSDMNRTPKRLSIPMDVSPGRYEVRVRRTTPSSSEISSTQQQTSKDVRVDNVVWVGLRAYIQGSTTYAHEHLIGIRMKADNQLSNQSSRQFGVIATRILPVWNGTSFVEQATRNPLWAFWDAATNSLYGARRPPSKLDFQAIYDAAQDADLRGDTFNYQFKTSVTIPAAFDTILASVRSKHCWVGDVLSVVRDEWRAIPSMLLTDHQIVRGSLEVVSVFNDESGADCVIGEFLNEDTWNPAEIQYPPNGSGFVATTPSRIRINGVTNADQMLREVAFIYKQSMLRRTKVNLSTEHDGRLLRLMSAVKVQSHLPQTWGFAGEVVRKLVDGLTLVLDREVPVLTGTTYIEFRDKRGKHFGPIICTKVAGEPLQVKLDATDLATVESQLDMTLDEALDRMDGAEPPSFVYGQAGKMSRDCIVLTGRPNGDRVDLTLAVDYSDVHDGNIGTTPTQPIPPAVFNPAIPVISSLYAVFRMGVAEPMIDATWWPVAGALGYRAQISYNSGVDWLTIYEGIQPGFSGIPVSPMGLKLRVLAFNTVIGPWSETTVSPPKVVVAPNTVAPSSLQSGLEDYVMSNIKDMRTSVNFIAGKIANLAAEQDAANYIDKRFTRNILQAQVNNIKVSIDETAQIATTISGRLAGLWMLTINNDGYISGMYSYNDGQTSNFAIVADRFQLQSPGVNGGEPVPVFDVITSGSSAKLVLKGDFIASGSIKAYHLDVTTLSAVSANLGVVKTGRIESNSGRFVVDADAERFVIYRVVP